MIKLQLEIYISSEPDEIFSYLTDFEQQPNWECGVVDISVEKATQQIEGTRLCKVRKTMGKMSEYFTEITKYDPEKRILADKIIRGSFPASATWSVESLGSLNKLAVEIIAQPDGLMRFFEPLLAKVIKNNMQQSLQNIKKNLQS